MKKFLILLLALLFTSPALASPGLWFCKDEKVAFFLILDSDTPSFILFDDEGKYIGAGRLVLNKTPQGNPYWYGEEKNIAVGVTDLSETSLGLGFTNGEITLSMVCK